MTKAVRVLATAVHGRDLEPGDLFSLLGPDYWDRALDGATLGESVFIRTNLPTELTPDPNTIVCKITIEVYEAIETIVLVPDLSLDGTSFDPDPATGFRRGPK